MSTLAVLVGIWILGTGLAGHAYVGETVAEYSLSSGNNRAAGLAYNDHLPAGRLYVSDFHGRIYVYKLGIIRKIISGTVSQSLKYLPKESIKTDSLNPHFIKPRGLAFSYYNGKSYLYALTSNDINGDGSVNARLWRIDLDNPKAETTEFCRLNKEAFNIAGRDVNGLTYFGGRVYISYNASGLESRVHKGILVLKVNDFNWQNAKWGKESVVWRDDHLPDSGISMATGLAYMRWDSTEYLWGTAGNKLIYLADGLTGRGIFCV